MRDCCPAHAFSGCCAGTGCTSATVPLIVLEEKNKRRTAERIAIVDQMIAGSLAMLALSGFMLVYLFVAVPELQRQAKIDQEQVAIGRRG